MRPKSEGRACRGRHLNSRQSSVNRRRQWAPLPFAMPSQLAKRRSPSWSGGQRGTPIAPLREERSGGSVSATKESDDERQRSELADAIARRRDDIERRWLERIKSVIKRDDVNSTELRNSMPDYLDR